MTIANTSTSAGKAEHGLIAAARQAADAISTALGADRPVCCNILGYQILREIHRGGQGVVYQAVQKATGQNVALKVMREGPFARPQDRARFEREVQILGQLNHPHIVTIHDSGTAEGHFYLVMNYIAGEPLDVYIASRRLSVKETLSLFVKICDAVNAAHLIGVTHRDCKPSNVRIDADGNPHILDFGLAKMAADAGGDDQQANAMTLTGQFIGSLPWASPEQALGDPARIDIRTDVYSLGVMLYQMLTGKFPYVVTGNASEVLNNIIHTNPNKPGAIRPQINNEVETIILKCIHKERERRYQTAGELSRDLQHYLEGRPIEAKRDSSWYVLRKTMRRHQVATGVIFTFLLLITASATTLLVMYRSVVSSRDQAVDAERAGQEQLAKTQSARDESQAVTKFLSNMLASVQPSIAQGREVSVRDILDEAGTTVEKDFGDKPLVQAAIRATIGKTYMGLGLYGQAESHLRAAYDIHTQKLGDEHTDTFQSRDVLRELLWNQGNYAAAEKLVNFSLEIRRRLLGEEHIETLRLRNHLSIGYHAQGDYAAAEKLRRDTLAISRRVLGDNHRFTLVCMNNLGFALYEQGNYTEAEVLLRQTLEIRQKNPGENHPQTVRTIVNLARVLGEQGKYAEAEMLHRKAVEISRRVNKDEHPDTLGLMNDLANVLAVQGKLDEARTYIAVILPHQKEAADPRSLNDYASLLLTCEPDDLRDPEAALSMAKKAVEISGGPVPDYFYTLALAYHRTGQIDEAIETQKQALAALPEVETAYRTDLELTLISLFKAKGDHQAADSLLHKDVTRPDATNDKERMELVQRVAELALLLKAGGKHKLCGSVCRALVNDVRLGGLHQGESGIATGLVALGSSLIQQERLGEADAILSKWLDIQQLGRNNWMKTHTESPRGRLNEFIEQVVKLFETQEGANPGSGHAEMAARWREKLKENGT